MNNMNDLCESDDNSSISSFPETWRDVPSVRSSPVKEVDRTIPDASSCRTTVEKNFDASSLNKLDSTGKELIVSTVDDLKLTSVSNLTKTSSPPHTPPLGGLLTPPRPPPVVETSEAVSRGDSAKGNKNRGGKLQNVVGVGGTTNLIVVPMYFRMSSPFEGTSNVGVEEPSNLACRGVLCKLLLMRDATKILKLKGNQNSLWAVFHYYARKQNSKDGQDKLRREIMKSYIYFKQQADRQSQLEIQKSVEDQSSPEFVRKDSDFDGTGSASGDVDEVGFLLPGQSPQAQSRTQSQYSLDQTIEDDNISSMTGDDDFNQSCVFSSSRAVMSVEDNKRMVETVDQIMQLLPSSTSNTTNSSKGSGKKSISLPSPVYNSALSDKFCILSPIMIVQLIDDFNMLAAYAKGSSGKNCGTVKENVNKERLLRIIAEIVCGDSLNPANGNACGTSASANSNQKSAPSTPPGCTKNRNGSCDNQSVGDGSAPTTGSMSATRSSFSNYSLYGSVHVVGKGSPVMPLQVMTTFINFITFQKVLFRVAIEMQYIYSRSDKDFMDRSLQWVDKSNTNPGCLNSCNINCNSPSRGEINEYNMMPNSNASTPNASIKSQRQRLQSSSTGSVSSMNSPSIASNSFSSQYFGSIGDAEPVDANLAIKKFLM